MSLSPTPSPLSADGERALVRYDGLLRRRVIVVALLGALTLAGMIADMATGPSGLTLGQTYAALTGSADAGRAAGIIVWQVRLPVAIMAVCVGAALSLAGAEMQTILDNALASPFTLGVSAAASFGAALAIILGISLPFVPAPIAVPVNAFAFAFLSTILLQLLARRGFGSPDLLVLFGIALVFTFNALLALVQFMASADALQQFVFWSMGSLSRSNWNSVAVTAAVVAFVLPFSLASAWRMTALRLGVDRARSYGIDIDRLRLFSLLRVSLLAGTAVAFVGTIGFVGLVGPHIARSIVGEDHRFFLPASALTGALVMSLASIASKLILPGALLPIGIVTSLVGLPVFFSLLLKRRHR